jgi:hypothetical protein
MTFFDYFLVFLASAVGIIFHACVKMGSIQAQDPSLTAWQVVKLFIKMDWLVLVSSACACLFGLICLYVGLRVMAAGKFVNAIFWAIMLKEPIFGLLGYQGNKWFYKFAGTTDKFVTKKLEESEK